MEIQPQALFASIHHDSAAEQYGIALRPHGSLHHLPVLVHSLMVLRSSKSHSEGTQDKQDQIYDNSPHIATAAACAEVDEKDEGPHD